jgi:hypothetical protein
MRYMTPNRLLSVLCVLMLMAAFSEQSIAQTPTPTPTPQAAPTPEFLSITVVSVKPEMIMEFQNFMKNTTNPALKKGGLKRREVWQSTGAAGDAFEYVLVAPVGQLAEFDGPGALEKGLGAQGLPAWQAKAGSLVNSVRRFIIRTRPDLSFAAQRGAAPKLAVLHFVRIAPNRNNDYENYLKNDFVPVMKQAGVTYLVSQTIFGGNANEYITLTMRDSFADLDKGPVLVQALGQEGAQKLIQRMPVGTVVHLERSLARFVPELSIMPAP